MTVTYPTSREGLYDPRNEHDSCGIGFVVDIKNRKSHQTNQGKPLPREGLSIHCIQ